MKKINRSKIYFLALFHLLLPKKIKQHFIFKTSPEENLAIGTTMIKIKYWRSFLRKHKMEKKIYFPKLNNYNL